MSHQDEKEITISYALSTGKEETTLSVRSGVTCGDVTEQAKEHFACQGSEGREWIGRRTGGEWSLREVRHVEEGKWWTEAEVEAYEDCELRALRGVDCQLSPSLKNIYMAYHTR